MDGDHPIAVAQYRQALRLVESLARQVQRGEITGLQKTFKDVQAVLLSCDGTRDIAREGFDSAAVRCHDDRR